MSCNPITTYEEIDWTRLWQNSRQKKSWASKGAGDWDKKARSFQERNQNSDYVPQLLAKIPLTPETTILDIGSGPGTLSLPLAAQAAKVTAVDYSAGMLEALRDQAKVRNLHNITTIQGAWEDDWQSLGIKVHDIAIASRSLNVADLSLALGKLNHYARRLVVVSDRVSPTPFEPGAFTAVGRDFQSGPDYIYTLNTLYSMDIHPTMDIIELAPESEFSSMEEALKSYTWMLKELNAEESKRLRAYLASQVVHSHGERITIRREHPPRWAVLTWKPLNGKLAPE